MQGGFLKNSTPLKDFESSLRAYRECCGRRRATCAQFRGYFQDLARTLHGDENRAPKLSTDGTSIEPGRLLTCDRRWMFRSIRSATSGIAFWGALAVMKNQFRTVDPLSTRPTVLAPRGNGGPGASGSREYVISYNSYNYSRRSLRAGAMASHGNGGHYLSRQV
jgi:hypothetical protein